MKTTVHLGQEITLNEASGVLACELSSLGHKPGEQLPAEITVKTRWVDLEFSYSRAEYNEKEDELLFHIYEVVTPNGRRVQLQLFND